MGMQTISTKRHAATACSRYLAGLALLALLALPTPASAAERIDHAPWTRLLAEHVAWGPDGVNTTVDYRGFQGERKRLRDYLETLSAVTRAQFDRWPRPARTAFLVNAYNAFTVELILRHHPEIESIRDIGGLFGSPWKQRFFELLGAQRHLDEVEHEMLRGAPGFTEPRIHFAVNCASVGCPALRPEAYTGARLDTQLADQTRRFLRDRARNRFDPDTGKLIVSPLFQWYREDFELGFRATATLAGFLGLYAEALGDTPAARQRIRAGDFELAFGEYDWSLNNRRGQRR